MNYAPKMICEKCGNYSMAYRNLPGLKEKDICKCDPLFTKTDVEAMRIETLEKAAKVCEEQKQEWNASVYRHGAIAAIGGCAAAIRSMR